MSKSTTTVSERVAAIVMLLFFLFAPFYIALGLMPSGWFPGEWYAIPLSIVLLASCILGVGISLVIAIE